MLPRFQAFLALTALVCVLATSALTRSVIAPGEPAPAPPRAARALGDNLVAIRPEEKTVTAGETFTVDVTIEGPADVVASDVQILFDTNFLECLSVTHSGVFDGYFIDNSNLAMGKIWFGGGTFGVRTPPFVYVTLTFRAKDIAGATTLALNPAETDVQGELGTVLGGLVNGIVTIQAAVHTDTPTPSRTPRPAPTHTPTPSATPTSTATQTPTATDTPSPTSTVTPVPDNTPSPTPSATAPTWRLRLPLILR